MSGNRPVVLGPVIDGQTRCIHYQTARDVIAIKFSCCLKFYPCHLCHAHVADHDASQWPVDDFRELAVLCGVCGHLLDIAQYLVSDCCPECAAEFNPGCKDHRELYFQR